MFSFSFSETNIEMQNTLVDFACIRTSTITSGVYRYASSHPREFQVTFR